MCLLLDAVAELHQLRLQLHSDGIQIFDFHIEAHLCVPQCAFQ